MSRFHHPFKNQNARIRSGSLKYFRVNFRFAPCGLVTLTVLLQTFKNSHFTP
ncbi:hypothetical protein Hanom_Chr09g00852991 [Helianthus anomalus]